MPYALYPIVADLFEKDYTYLFGDLFPRNSSHTFLLRNKYHIK
jgi:hypothetical protein